MVNNIQADGMHSADVERLQTLHNSDNEEFTLTWQHKDKVLILKVNGVERNKLTVSAPEDKFEMCLKWIKDQFISWRNLKN
tara:strand:- start:320 stop:562 length:243 start_codon:yes stop_codon:yes gene_type:complete